MDGLVRRGARRSWPPRRRGACLCAELPVLPHPPLSPTLSPTSFSHPRPPLSPTSFSNIFHTPLLPTSLAHLFHPPLSPTSLAHLFHPSHSPTSFANLFRPPLSRTVSMRFPVAVCGPGPLPTALLSLHSPVIIRDVGASVRAIPSPVPLSPSPPHPPASPHVVTQNTHHHHPA